MTKKLFTFFLALAASVGTMFAEKVQIGDLYYYLNATNKTAEVTSMPSGKYSGDITIPSSVEDNSVTYNVTSIEDHAFIDCSSLTSITIPNSVTSIGEWAFAASGLSTIYIPNSVSNIAIAAFSCCPNMTNIVVDTDNPIYDSRNNCNAIIETVTNTIITGCKTTSLPDDVVCIGARAFASCGLTSLVIPNGVTKIEHDAFAGCSELESIVLPNSLTTIDYGAFWNCSMLTSVIIPRNVTSIEHEAFANCYSLNEMIVLNPIPAHIGEDVLGYTNNTNTGTSVYVPCGTLEDYQTQWSAYSSNIKYRPVIVDAQVNIIEAGYVTVPTTICDSLMWAIVNNGYHFVQWSDGNTDNPRTIVLTQDTTFTAEFAKNLYTITTSSANPDWGTTEGASALYLDEVQISALPNYGYHFDHWNDGNTSNPRTITLTEDKTYTATFAKNVYNISKQYDSEQGSISGPSQAEYLDEVSLTAEPNYGYHFTRWSDGLKDNPRSFVLTKDTIFTAEFALDRSGKCGNDWSLTWEYDTEKHVLTISGEGAFNENMQCGVEAKPAMTHLVINKGVTSIGEGAFSGCSYLSHLTIGESVKTIHNNAFYNCVNLETIFNYRPTPTNTYSNAFDGVDKFECKLYVLANSIDLYKAASVWRDFYYTYAIGAEEATLLTNDVTIEPQDNTATITWPTSENAATYTIEITKDGEVFCTLIFNGNGQLTGIAFAPGKNGNRHAPAAQMTANGLQFTVTGLNSATHYALTLQAKDDQDAVLASYSSEFTTTGEAQGIDQITNDNWQMTNKIIKDGQIFILRGDKTYTLTGQEVR